MKRTIGSISFLLFITMSLNAQAYVEEKIQFTTGDGLTLSGYLTRPAKPAASPALILQLGSGKGTTDSEARPYNPFAEIARKIAEHGFAVLRFDKRGTGYNSANGSFEDSTFNDYVSDFKAAVSYMRGREEVSRKSLFYMSHSLGGQIIMTAAADIPPTGIILSASPGRSFAEYNIEQLRYLYEFGEGLKGQSLSKKLEEDRKFNGLLDNPEETCRQYPERCDKRGTKIIIDGQNSEFWKEISGIDPIRLVKKVHCPVLVINGTSDWVISSENDAKTIFTALHPNRKNSLKILDGLDHFFVKIPSKRASVRSFLKAGQGAPVAMKMHPGFIAALGKWLDTFLEK